MRQYIKYYGNVDGHRFAVVKLSGDVLPHAEETARVAAALACLPRNRFPPLQPTFPPQPTKNFPPRKAIFPPKTKFYDKHFCFLQLFQMESWKPPTASCDQVL